MLRTAVRNRFLRGEAQKLWVALHMGPIKWLYTDALNLLEMLSIRVSSNNRLHDTFYVPSRLSTSNYLRNAPLNRIMRDINAFRNT